MERLSGLITRDVEESDERSRYYSILGIFEEPCDYCNKKNSDFCYKCPNNKERKIRLTFV